MEEIKEKILKLGMLYDDFKNEEDRFEKEKNFNVPQEILKKYKAYSEALQKLEKINFLKFGNWIKKEIVELKNQMENENGKSDKIITFSSTDVFKNNSYFPELKGKFLTPELAKLIINQQENALTVYTISVHLYKNLYGKIGLDNPVPYHIFTFKKDNKRYDVNSENLDKFLK